MTVMMIMPTTTTTTATTEGHSCAKINLVSDFNWQFITKFHGFSFTEQSLILNFDRKMFVTVS
jgi:hypothetical protein